MTTQAAPAPQANATDPYLWLENITGEKALQWVREHNARSLQILESQPRFAAYRARIAAILSDKHRIPTPRLQGDQVDNLWRDDSHVRGLWRRASLSSYLSGHAAWQTLLDVDALAKAEGKNWVWQGATCLKPDYERCLVALSNGGQDAVTVREFDTSTGQFVADGFHLAEAKMQVAWLDRDTLLVGTDFGQGSLTDSGYPRIVKLWQRGTALAAARPLYEAKAEDMMVAPQVTINHKGTYPIIMRRIDFFTTELYHLRKDGSLVRSPLPRDADLEQVLGSKAIALLRHSWTEHGVTHPEGSLVAYDIDALLQGRPAQVEQVFTPQQGQAISAVIGARDVLYVNVLHDVRSRLLALRPNDGAWQASDLEAGQDMAIELVSASPTSNLMFFQREGYTTPPQLVAAGDGPMRVVYALPARFDPSRYTVEQLFAPSKDGTPIPYWVVKPRGAKGPLPVWMFAYGGFAIPLVPSYLNPEYQFWVEEGGAYVVANLRGGGEYGPAWHQAALRERRQYAYDDLFAVAEDMLRRGLTTSRQLGLYGRSNGGLLASVALTQRPDLYGAIIAGVPLTDMKRYHKLLAGASWMAEYGNPDNPNDWAFISAYSPYQNLQAGEPYPQIFSYTSTKDDRVHPGHARKMVARLEKLGYPCFYYENTAGGHAGVANLKETAYRAALMLVYMNSQLKTDPPVAAPRMATSPVGNSRPSQTDAAVD